MDDSAGLQERFLSSDVRLRERSLSSNVRLRERSLSSNVGLRERSLSSNASNVGLRSLFLLPLSRCKLVRLFSPSLVYIKLNFVY